MINLHDRRTGYNYYSPAWRHQYRSSRNEWITLHGDALLRSMAYRACFWVFIASVCLFPPSVIANFFVPSGRFDWIILGALALSIVCTMLSLIISLAMKLAILPLYERIRMWAMDRPCRDCATCAIASFPPDGT